MRVNVFSPDSYTWERFAELQHQYAMARKRLELRHFDKLEEARNHERINENIVNKQIIKSKLLNKEILKDISHNELLKETLKKELNRIDYERSYLENLFLIGKKIKNHTNNVLILRKILFDKYLLELKIEDELRNQKDLLYKNELEKQETKTKNRI
ncbi:hypothetical protein [Spirobacillus cienkowskii]|uniref:hypothetical protein n=1 Tax=Spirobacillus cienkowskii TaxID=495820 RepID=UPI0030D491F8